MAGNKRTANRKGTAPRQATGLATRKERARQMLEEVRAPSSSLCPRETRNIDALLVRDARLPMTCWREGWVLREIEDGVWLTITAETHPFPRCLRPNHRGHPGYVLEEIGNYALRICPCSSLPQSGPLIPWGAVLQPTGVINDRDTYLVEGSAVVLSRDGAPFQQHPPRFLGIFPPEKLQR